jgi:hypothetical protein
MMMPGLVLAGILSSLASVASATSIVYIINKNTDAVTTSPTNCADTSALTCTLRSAWLACANISTSSGNECVIQLPETNVELSYGTLDLHVGSHIKIVGGNNSTVLIRHDERFITFDPEVMNYSVPSVSLGSLVLIGGGKGGGIFLSGNVKATFSYVRFVDLESGSGGGLYIEENSAAVMLNNCSFTRCIAFKSGGAVFADNNLGSLTIASTNFTGCEATGIANNVGWF